MIYQFHKGRIVTITWKHGGQICKILARPGQIVFDNYTKDIRILLEHEYIVYTNELRIDESTEYLVAQMNTKPLPGILVNSIHLSIASNYEKKLRKLGISKSPFYDIEEPEGTTGEIIVFNKLTFPFTGPRMLRIKKANGYPNFPLYELSNGEIIERGSLKLFYRKPIEYEINLYQKKENCITKNSFTIGGTS